MQCSTQYIPNLESGSENIRQEYQYLHIEMAMDVKVPSEKSPDAWWIFHNILKFIKTFEEIQRVCETEMTCRTILYVANLAVYMDRA